MATIRNRADGRWAHPESVDEGMYTIQMQDMLALCASPAGVNAAQSDAMAEQVMQMVGADPSRTWTAYETEAGCPEEPEARVRMLVGMPAQRKEGRLLPCVFCVPGGGLVFGGRGALSAGMASMYLPAAGVEHVVVTFDYRLAPDDKYPAAVNDVHAAWLWMVGHADELGIDLDRVAIWGVSSGGHLALAGAFRLKRYGWCGAPMPRGVIVQVPVMDDVAETSSFGYRFDLPGGGKGAWDGEHAQETYRAWLGERFGDPALPPEAVPNRATAEDVAGYPPVWIPAEAEFESGRDSLVAFAQLLWDADIFCDLHVWGGTSHQGFTASQTDFAGRCNAVLAGAVRDALTYDFRRQWLQE